MRAKLGLVLLALCGTLGVPAAQARRKAGGHERSAGSAPRLDPAPVDPVARARAREDLLSSRAATSEARARSQALAAYRLARLRSADIMTDPRKRADVARALDGALLVLRRSAHERTAWQRAWDEARRERLTLEGATALGRTGRAVQILADHGDGLADATHPGIMLASVDSPGPQSFVPLRKAGLRWPARGTVMSGPGLRRDPGTGTETVAEGIELLGRMNDPVHAVGDGVVRKVVALPQGRYAVVTSHPDDRIAITSGLRQVDVEEGSEISNGQRLGLLGRDLDGAPVLSFELWQGGTPVDPRPFFGR